MDFPISINWMSLFPIMWSLGGIFNFSIQVLKETANSGEPDQTPHYAASDLVLHCLPMPHNKGARLI